MAVVGKEPDVDSTAKTVAENVKRLRVAQNMNYKQLAERLLAATTRSINAVGIRRIEDGERRVTPDDLTALAVALGVSPITLLMPESVDKSELVEVTGFEGDLTAEQLWRWLSAVDTLPQTPKLVQVLGPALRIGTFGFYAWPEWMQEDERRYNLADLDHKLRQLGIKDLGDD